MKTLVLFVCCFVACLSVKSQTLVGSWTGELEVGLQKLRLVFRLDTNAQGIPVGFFDSPDQGAKDIPVRVEHWGNDSLALAVPAISATYQGRYRDGQIDGTFAQSGFRFPLLLKPGTVEQNRPQTPQPPFPYAMEEVRFTNPDDGTILAGTLVYPVDYTLACPVPVVLLVTGSGQQNRDEELFGHKPFLVLADYLARHGIASLRYDDRGGGKSTGDAAQVTLASNLQDALAGIRYLQARKQFSAVGILGHSEGGLIAFLAAGCYPDTVDFIISLAGNALSGKEVLVEQNRLGLLQGGAPSAVADDYCRVLQEVFACRLRGVPVVAASRTIDSLVLALGVELPVALKANLVKVLELQNPWIDSFLACEPAGALSGIHCPVMAVYGSLDTQVLPQPNLNALRDRLSPDARHFLKIYPGLNHLFQPARTGSAMEYATIEITLSPELLLDIANWINSLQ